MEGNRREGEDRSVVEMLNGTQEERKKAGGF